MSSKRTYLRIGTDYFKKVNKPSMDGDSSPSLIKWSRQAIVDDLGSKELKFIKRYHGFTVVPSHDNFQQEVAKFYNKYQPLTHTIDDKPRAEKDVPHTINFLQHIFGEQFDIGLDYLTLLWQKPTQILPILCLVSEERSTGKTTFLNWLKLIFQANMTFNKNADFRSQFNADWSEHLIIGVDEVLLDKKEDSERIKNLSTAKTYKTEKKGIDKVETPFFGKFILCSNNETNFMLVDEFEIRYWVRKITPIGELDPDFMEKLEEEVNAFANLIAKRKIKNPNKSRMWFTPKQLHTEALTKLIVGTKFQVEKEILLYLQGCFEEYDVTELYFTVNDLLENLPKNLRIGRTTLNNVLKGKWKMEAKNSSYTYHKRVYHSLDEYVIEESTRKGRFYTFTKEFVLKELNC